MSRMSDQPCARCGGAMLRDESEWVCASCSRRWPAPPPPASRGNHPTVAWSAICPPQPGNTPAANRLVTTPSTTAAATAKQSSPSVRLTATSAATATKPAPTRGTAANDWPGGKPNASPKAAASADRSFANRRPAVPPAPAGTALPPVVRPPEMAKCRPRPVSSRSFAWAAPPSSTPNRAPGVSLIIVARTVRNAPPPAAPPSGR